MKLFNHRVVFGAVVAASIVGAPSGATAQGGLIYFSDQGAFHQAMAGAGKFLKGVEDFEEARIGAGQVSSMDDPLDVNTNNNFFQPGEIEENLIIQSNLGQANSSVVNPRGSQGLALLGANFFGNPDKTVVANFFVDSLDLIFTSRDKTGIGFMTQSYAGGTSAKIDVYSDTNVLLGTTTVGASNAGVFFGVQAVGGAVIGRINIYDPFPGAEGADNIEMWVVPEPGTMLALGFGLAGLAAARRRRNNK